MAQFVASWLMKLLLNWPRRMALHDFGIQLLRLAAQTGQASTTACFCHNSFFFFRFASPSITSGDFDAQFPEPRRLVRSEKASPCPLHVLHFISYNPIFFQYLVYLTYIADTASGEPTTVLTSCSNRESSSIVSFCAGVNLPTLVSFDFNKNHFPVQAE